jgi:hypothetical protein
VTADVAENEAIFEAQHSALLDEMRQQARYGAMDIALTAGGGRLCVVLDRISIHWLNFNVRLVCVIQAR